MFFFACGHPPLIWDVLYVGLLAFHCLLQQEGYSTNNKAAIRNYTHPLDFQFVFIFDLFPFFVIFFLKKGGWKHWIK